MQCREEKQGVKRDKPAYELRTRAEVFNNGTIKRVEIVIPARTSFRPGARRAPCLRPPKKHAMQLLKTFVPLALLPAALTAADLTVFHTDFNSDSLNQASFTPTATSTTWNIASTKNATSSLAGGDLALGIPSTTSGFLEAQTVFSSTPYQLANVTDALTVTVTFTATNNILTVGTGSQLFAGLFQSGGVKPLANLQSSGLSTTVSSPNATGGTQLWQGYNSRISFDGGNSAVITRPMQNGAGTTSANQDLLFQGGGGQYPNPTGTTLVTSNTAAATTALTNGNPYTLVFQITRSDATTLSISNTLFDGVGTSGTNLATISSTATAANLLTDTFDGLAIGYRFSNNPGAASSITFTDLEVVYTSTVPEPSTYAAILGVAGLALAALRRRRD